MEEFEKTWEKGKTYIATQSDIKKITCFSSAISRMLEHRQFVTALETMDSSIFFTIPSLLILYSLENNDKVSTYVPLIKQMTTDPNIRQLYNKLKIQYDEVINKNDKNSLMDSLK